MGIRRDIQIDKDSLQPKLDLSSALQDVLNDERTAVARKFIF